MGWIGDTWNFMAAGRAGDKVGRELADQGGDVPESPESMLRLAQRCGVNIQYEEDLEVFGGAVDESYCERMIENGEDERDKDKGFWGWLVG